MVVGIGADGSRYWVRLMEYIQRRGEMQAFLCTNEESLREQLAKKNAEFLFLQEGCFDEIPFDVPRVYFTMNRDADDAIYQLQPAKQVYQEILRHIQRPVPVTKTMKKGVYAVYSPHGRSGKTSFSLAYAKAHSFFYIGMEEYGIKGNNNRGMEEVLYHIRNRKENITQNLHTLSESYQGVSIVASPTYFSDIRMLEAEDYRWFLDCIRADDTLPSVIVDFGTGSLVDFEVLEYFDKVYVPLIQEDAMDKWNRFEELYWETNGDMKGKLIRIVVPQMPWTKEGFLEEVRYMDRTEY